jgi:hypothetical protein
VVGIMSTHVDDFLWGGDIWMSSNVILKIGEKITVGTVEDSNFKFTGIHLTSSVGPSGLVITTSMSEYIKGILPIDIEDSRPLDSPFLHPEYRGFRGLVGALLWVGTQLRPDVLVEVSLLGRFFECGTVKNLRDANKLLRKSQSLVYDVTYVPLRGKVSMSLYTDAAWANVNMVDTQGGHVILLLGEDNVTCNVISWVSRKLQRVVRSTLAGETQAMLAGIDEAMCLAFLFDELTGNIHSSVRPTPVNVVRPTNLENKVLPIFTRTDCKSIVDHLSSQKPKGSDKRLVLDLQHIKQDLEEGNVSSVQWCATDRNLADGMTKPGKSKNLVHAIVTNTVEQ